MIDPKRYVSPVVGTVVTTGIFLLPVSYADAPVSGALTAGSSQRSGLLDGRQAGSQMGVIMTVGMTIVAALVATGSVLPGSATQAYAAGMSESGPQTFIFYAVLAFLYEVYATLVGTVVGPVIGVVRA